jgi:site-specific recombinase
MTIDFLLDQKINDKKYEDQILWLENILRWLKHRADPEGNKISKERVLNAKIKYLLNLLSRNPNWKSNFISNFSSLLIKISSLHFFTQVGLNSRSGFLQDFIGRLEEKILPQSPLTDVLSTFLFVLFSEEDCVSIDHIEDEVMSDFLSLFESESNLVDKIKDDLVSSFYVLSSYLLANNFYIDREVSKKIERPENKLESLVLFKAYRMQKDHDFSDAQELQELLDLCETSRKEIYRYLQSSGIKIEVVYLLESQRRRIERLKQIAGLILTNQKRTAIVRNFISQLIIDIHHQRSLRSFISENLNLLTQRIVRRNSDVGEHYVTFNKTEFKEMFRSALGGGGLTSFTVFLKMFISGLPLTGFIKGLLEGLNYSGSFLLIQIMGWTLATKQPSTTAPYLAESLKKSISESQRAVIALLRTQFIAVVGNLTLVFPICFLISYLFFYFQLPLMNEAMAMKNFTSPQVSSFSPLFAIFTGLLLFFSSLIAGWAENWVLLNKLPKRILHNQTLHKYIGGNATAAFSSFVAKNANALAANISLGFLLGLAPQYLKFMGIPLEVRHVTLATGSFATSLPLLLNSDLIWADYINSIFGLLLIGFLNISVSFGLALILASFSSQIRLSVLWALLKWGIVLVLTKPWLLFIPEQNEKREVHK